MDMTIELIDKAIEEFEERIRIFELCILSLKTEKALRPLRVNKENAGVKG